MRQPLVAGNWKMNGSRDSVKALLDGLKAGISTVTTAEVAVCCPHAYLADVQASLTGSAIAWGGQDVSIHDSGAYTGETAGSMLTDFGAKFVIIGHSERRQYHGETDQVVNAKAKAAIRNEITPIICVGEGLDIRKAGDQVKYTLAQVDGALAGLSGAQVENLVIAYEPVWAIGTGEVATPDDAQEVCGAIRSRVSELHGNAADKLRILYGGSMKADNVAALMAMPDVDGGLVGGASLDPDEFVSVCRYRMHGN